MNPSEALKKQEKELGKFINENNFSKKEVIVLEKNENSFLVPLCKESTQEFFEKIFSFEGSFWRAYEELCLGEAPIGKKYAFTLANQLYFCKNIEDKYIYFAGTKKQWIAKGEKPIFAKHINADWLIRTLAAPFDSITHTKNAIVDAFKINELFLNFAEEIKDSEKSLTLANEGKVSSIQAEEFLNKANKVMFYSFAASLGQYLKLSPGEKLSPIIEETKLFFQKANSGETAGNEFLSENVYDISLSRIGANAKKPPEMILPKDDWMILREAARIACARHLYAQRKAYLSAGKEIGLDEKVFFLTTKELQTLQKAELNKIAQERSKPFEENNNILLPKRIFYYEKWFFEEETPLTQEKKTTPLEFEGLNAGAKVIVKGPIGWVHGEIDLKKNFNGKIIATDYFSPNLVVTYTGALGVISTVGGMLSHPAIVAREKNMPCVLQVQGLAQIKENYIIELNGANGKIKIITEK